MKVSIKASVKSFTTIIFILTIKLSVFSQSKLYTDSIYSTYLKEYRKHIVYLPSGFNQSQNYPIIYATDGQFDFTEKKASLDSLIEKKLIKPIIFVGSFSNEKIADSTSTKLGNGEKVFLNYRNFEYVDRKPTRKEDSLLFHRFDNHKLYFIKELIVQVEKNLNQNLNKENRYFYGVSNGAGFGLNLLNTNPNLIGTYFCFSSFGGDVETLTWNKKTRYPTLFLKYGTLEPFFLKDDAEFLKERYKKSNSTIEIKEFVGGHNNAFWEKEFVNACFQVFKMK